VIFRTTDSRKVLLQYIAKWDSVVPVAAVGKLTASVERELLAGVADPEFQESWEVILDKCENIARHSPSNTKSFPWLFLKAFGGKPNWIELVMGKYDNQTRPQRAFGKLSAAEELEEQLRREENESKNNR
jgi:hypothetical protein